MFEQASLSNRATVYYIPLKDTPSVTVMIMYPVGSRYEPEKLSGVSHYIEHMMFKGTKKRPVTLKLTREIDRLGAEYNAFTGKEYTGYYIKTDSHYTETALDILSDMLFNSVFDPKEMEREKGPIIEEIRMYRDNPMMNIDNVFEDLLYAGCPLGRDIAGSEKHVLSYKRDEVLQFQRKYYQPKHMTIAVAGGITDKTKQLVEKYFGSYKNQANGPLSFKPSAFGPNDKKSRLFVDERKTDQTQLMLGFPGFSYGNKYNPALSVLNTVLGGSMSSRLFIQIRERRGLAYFVRSGSEIFRDTGYAYIRAGLDAKNVSKALAVMKSEINKIGSDGITKKELSDAKTHIRGALALAMEDSSAQANYYIRQALFYPSIKKPEERLREIDNVTHEDVIDVARLIYGWDKVRIAIIGNIDKKNIDF